MKTLHVGAALLAAQLAGCGGGGEDIGEGLGRALSCAIVGCTPSSTLATSDMIPRFVATRRGDRTVLSASFGTGKGFTTSFGDGIGLDTDQLVGKTPGASLLYFTSETDVTWEATHEPAGDSRVYTILLLRADGSRYSSSVKVPAAFSVVSPSTPTVITRSSPPVQFVVTVPETETLNLSAEGTCGPEKTEVSWSAVTDPVAHDAGSAYQIDPATMYAEIEFFYEIDPALCDLELTLARTSKGKVDRAFKAGGSFIGQYEQRRKLQLD